MKTKEKLIFLNFLLVYILSQLIPVSFYEHLPEVPDLIQHWLAGYRRIIDLPQADEDEIPTFVMLRRLLLVAWIGSHSETDLAQSMGHEYTSQTVDLCRTYLSKFGG